MSRLNSIFWKRIITNVELSEYSLAVFRIMAASWLLIFHFESFSWFGELPDFLMIEPPLSLANLFRSYPNRIGMVVIDLIRFICLVFLLLGVRAKYAGIFFFLLTVYCKSFQYTLGSIEHDFLLYLLILLLSFSNWGTILALMPDKKSRFSNQLLLGIYALCLCWGMFTAGLMKGLIWIDFNTETSGFMRWLTEGYYSMERNRFLTAFMLKANWTFLESMDYLVVVFELSPLLFLLVNRKWWLVWLFVAVSFHFINILVLNLIS